MIVTPAARARNCRDRILEHVICLHDAFDRVVEGATRGGEVILILDEHQRCCICIQV